MNFFNKSIIIGVIFAVAAINAVSVNAMMLRKNLSIDRAKEIVNSRLEEVINARGDKGLLVAKLVKALIVAGEKPNQHEKQLVIIKTEIDGANLLLKLVDWEEYLLMDFVLNYTKISKAELSQVLLATDPHGYNALHYVVKEGRFCVMQKLINVFDSAAILCLFINAQVKTPEGEQDDYNGLTPVQIANKRYRTAKISQEWVANDKRDGKEYERIAARLIELAGQDKKMSHFE